MREPVFGGLVRIYERAAQAGVLDRPRSRRGFEFAYLAYKKLIEAGPVDSLRGLIGHGSLVIDVGANIGFFSLRFARWVGPAGRVIAIEPEARNIDSLRRRVARAGVSDVVTCVQAAAADRSGELRLALNPSHPGDHHLAETGEPIAAVTLDELTADDRRPVALVKIDVQGAESMVLAGSRRMIERHRPALFVEIHEPSLVRLGSSCVELIDTVVDLGYGGHMLTRRGIRPPIEPDELVRRSLTGYIDVLFLPITPRSSPGDGDMGEHR